MRAVSTRCAHEEARQLGKASPRVHIQRVGITSEPNLAQATCQPLRKLRTLAPKLCSKSPSRYSTWHVENDVTGQREDAGMRFSAFPGIAMGSPPLESGGNASKSPEKDRLQQVLPATAWRIWSRPGLLSCTSVRLTCTTIIGAGSSSSTYTT